MRILTDLGKTNRFVHDSHGVLSSNKSFCSHMWSSWGRLLCSMLHFVRPAPSGHLERKRKIPHKKQPRWRKAIILCSGNEKSIAKLSFSLMLYVHLSNVAQASPSSMPAHCENLTELLYYSLPMPSCLSHKKIETIPISSQNTKSFTNGIRFIGISGKGFIGCWNRYFWPAKMSCASHSRFSYLDLCVLKKNGEDSEMGRVQGHVWRVCHIRNRSRLNFFDYAFFNGKKDANPRRLCRSGLMYTVLLHWIRNPEEPGGCPTCNR